MSDGYLTANVLTRGACQSIWRDSGIHWGQGGPIMSCSETNLYTCGRHFRRPDVGGANCVYGDTPPADVHTFGQKDTKTG